MRHRLLVLALGVCLLVPAVPAGAGDSRLLRAAPDSPDDGARPFLSDSAPDASLPTVGNPNRSLGLVLSGISLGAGVGLAMWLKNSADERYDAYLVTADPTKARELLEAAQRRDRASLVGWGLAQASFVSLIYFLTRERERPLVPVRGEPLISYRQDAVQVGIRVQP